MKSKFRRLKKFLTEVWLESKPGGRVNWPSYQQLAESTVLVLLVALIFLVYIAGVDWVFENLFAYLARMFEGT